MSIWRYKEIVKSLPAQGALLLTLHESDTPVNKIELNGLIIFLKREDLNPTGSWKDRATAYKLSLLKAQGVKEAVLVSSGNAAISFLTYSQLYPELVLHIVLKNVANSTKVGIIQKLLTNTHHKLYLSNTPKATGIKISSLKKAINLRSGNDPLIYNSYLSLGFELAELLNKKEANNQTAIFMPVSSGTAFIGAALGINQKLGDEYNMPKLIACQTEAVHPLKPELESIVDKSVADSIFDKICENQQRIKKIITNSNGAVLVPKEEDIVAAKNLLLDKFNINISYTSALAFAAALKGASDLEVNKAIVLCSGR